MCAARKNNSLEESDDSAKQPAKKRKPRAATKEAKLASASKKSLKKNAAPETEDYESEAAPYAGKTEKFFGEESANVKSEKICGNDGANASGENEGAAKNPLYKDTEFFPSDGFKRHIARIKAAKSAGGRNRGRWHVPRRVGGVCRAHVGNCVRPPLQSRKRRHIGSRDACRHTSKAVFCRFKTQTR